VLIFSENFAPPFPEKEVKGRWLFYESSSMKTPSGTFKYLLVAVALLAIAACATLTQGEKAVELGEYGAVIRPEAKVSASDWDAINSVLKKYRKSLYKIQTFKNGSLTETRGALDEKYIREGLVSEVAKAAQTTQFTGSAIQLAFTSSTKQPSPPPPPPVSYTSSTKVKQPLPPPDQLKQAKELMERLRPILERYIKT